MSIPSSAIYMLGYDVLLRSLSPYLTPAPAATTLQSQTLPGNIGGNPDASYLTPTPFVAGALARTLSATVISPMELFRTRLQALPQRESPSVFCCDSELNLALRSRPSTPHLCLDRRIPQRTRSTTRSAIIVARTRPNALARRPL